RAGVRRHADDRLREGARPAGSDDPHGRHRRGRALPAAPLALVRRARDRIRAPGRIRLASSKIPGLAAFGLSSRLNRCVAGPDGDDLSAPTGQDSAAILRARLARTEQQAAARQRQLERYAADLREVFKQERTRAQELRRSYRATVRALSNAVEARDASPGKHAARVTAYGMELARRVGISLEESPQIEFGFLLHDIGK